MVVHEGPLTAKAHVCLDCFEQMQDYTSGTADSVSLQEYNATEPPAPTERN
jgi:hypothetical protein